MLQQDNTTHTLNCDIDNINIQNMKARYKNFRLLKLDKAIVLFSFAQVLSN